MIGPSRPCGVRQYAISRPKLTAFESTPCPSSPRASVSACRHYDTKLMHRNLFKIDHLVKVFAHHPFLSCMLDGQVDFDKPPATHWRRLAVVSTA